MAIDIVPKEGPAGAFLLEISDNGTTIHMDVSEVPEVQRLLTSAVVDAKARECESRTQVGRTVVVPPNTSLGWSREGTGSHSYVAAAPGGVVCRVKLLNGAWEAVVDDIRIGTYGKKRQAQVSAEQHVFSRGAATVSFMEEA